VSEFFLGIIAVAVLAMAIGQVAALVLAGRAFRRLGESVSRLEHDLRPIIANVEAMTADAARAASLAATQVERAERVLNDAAHRVEDTMLLVRKILTPARDGMAILSGIKAAVSAFWDLKAASRRRTAPSSSPLPVAIPDPGDEDHASFIG